jgi:hypothetical protein
MSFANTARNIRIDEDHILRAELFNAKGELIESEIDLDGIIGNDGGMLSTLGRHVSNSMQDISSGVDRVRTSTLISRHADVR